MEWQHERRLVFLMSERWSGWFCERCCWNQPLPMAVGELLSLGACVGDEFGAHDCEQFALENWGKRATRPIEPNQAA